MARYLLSVTDDTDLDAIVAELAPVARRGPRGQGVGRVSEPPAYGVILHPLSSIGGSSPRQPARPSGCAKTGSGSGAPR